LVAANEFDELLRSIGKGLLSRHRVDIRIFPGINEFLSV